MIAAVYVLSPQAQQGLSVRAATSSFKRAVGMVIPIFVLAGIFGNPMLMVTVLLLATLALAATVFSVRSVLTDVPQMKSRDTSTSHTTVPALSAQSSGEIIPEINIRALCRGLPPAVTGQVFATVEHLEMMVAEAKRSGDTRRAYDAQQGLKDYLPTTINAWKAQTEDQRDVGELTRALEQVYENRRPTGFRRRGGTASLGNAAAISDITAREEGLKILLETGGQGAESGQCAAPPPDPARLGSQIII